VNIRQTIGAVVYRLFSERRDALLLRSSSYLDEDWYTARNPDTAGMPAALHYLRYGAFEGRNPSNRFSTSRYLAQYPDARDSAINPLVHYLRYGLARGHDPLGSDVEFAEDLALLKESRLFDPDWYCKTYPDVMSAGDPYAHFLVSGDAEGRRPGPEFNPSWYLTQYLDVRHGTKGPLLHYLRRGKAEGRMPGLTPAQRTAILETINDVESLDPEFQACDAVHQDLDSLRTNYFFSPLYLSNAWSDIFARLRSDIRVILFVSGTQPDTTYEAEVTAFIRAAVNRHGSSGVLVFLTEGACSASLTEAAGYEGVLALDDFYSGASSAERQRMVETLVFALLPTTVVNIDSRACWDAFAEKGKVLASIAGFYCYASTSDVEMGHSGGRDMHNRFRRCIHLLTRLYVPTTAAKSRLIEAYGLPDTLKDRIHVAAPPGTTDSNDASWEKFLEALQETPSFLTEEPS
jgi:hypothetical protein